MPSFWVCLQIWYALGLIGFLLFALTHTTPTGARNFRLFLESSNAVSYVYKSNLRFVAYALVLCASMFEGPFGLFMGVRYFMRRGAPFSGEDVDSEVR